MYYTLNGRLAVTKSDELCRFGWHPPRRLTCRKEDTACRRVHGGRQLKAPDPNAPNGTVRASHATSETRGSHSAASSFASVMRCCSAAVSRPFGQLETELLLLIERERGLIRRNKLRHTSNDRVQRLLLAWEYLDHPPDGNCAIATVRGGGQHIAERLHISPRAGQQGRRTQTERCQASQKPTENGCSRHERVIAVPCYGCSANCGLLLSVYHNGPPD
jgi:hypothetical protein